MLETKSGTSFVEEAESTGIAPDPTGSQALDFGKPLALTNQYTQKPVEICVLD